MDLSNLTLEPFPNVSTKLDIGGVHYIAAKGAYFVFVGFLEIQEDDNPLTMQVWITNTDNPYGAALETVEQWDNWLEVYTSPEKIIKNVSVEYENTLLINPAKVVIGCDDYLEAYVKLLHSKHLERYERIPSSFPFTDAVDRLTFSVLMEGKINRKPFIDKILESLE